MSGRSASIHGCQPQVSRSLRLLLERRLDLPHAPLEVLNLLERRVDSLSTVVHTVVHHLVREERVAEAEERSLPLNSSSVSSRSPITISIGFSLACSVYSGMYPSAPLMGDRQKSTPVRAFAGNIVAMPAQSRAHSVARRRNRVVHTIQPGAETGDATRRLLSEFGRWRARRGFLGGPRAGLCVRVPSGSPRTRRAPKRTPSQTGESSTRWGSTSVPRKRRAPRTRGGSWRSAGRPRPTTTVNLGALCVCGWIRMRTAMDNPCRSEKPQSAPVDTTCSAGGVRWSVAVSSFARSTDARCVG